MQQASRPTITGAALRASQYRLYPGRRLPQEKKRGRGAAIPGFFAVQAVKSRMTD
jgi:hypothetical protein